MGTFFAAHYLKTKITKMAKRALKTYEVKEPRSTIDLLIVVVDFDSVANATLFITTIAKRLLVTKLLSKSDKNIAPLNLVNFSSTYDKSRRINKITGSLFELIEESNEKTITDGGFGFEDRLKSFLKKDNNHLNSFGRFLNSLTTTDQEKEELIKQTCKLKQVDVETLITFTSSRGVSKTGVSLKEKELAMWRFDDFSVVEARYNPIENAVEPWRTQLNSDFTQLSGRIACTGNTTKDNFKNPKRVAILARATKKKQETENDSGTLSWLDGVQIFYKIPSIKINEKIIFCSFNSDVSIKEDDNVLNQPENREKYYDRIKEVASDDLLDEIFKHLQHVQPSVENSVTNNIVSSNKESIRKCIKLTFKSLEKLLNEIISDYKLSRKDFSITWKDNASYALSTSSQTSLLKKLSDLKKKYEKNNETDSQLTFKDFILKEWLSKNESSLFGAGGKRSRKPSLGISVERTVYTNKTINRFKSTLTSSEQKIYKKRMQKILKRIK